MTDTLTFTGWHYDPATRELTVGQVACTRCKFNRPEVGAGRHQVHGWVACGKCKGTGRRGGGQCRACDYYRADHTRHDTVGEYTPGMVADVAKPLDGGVCPACEGTIATDAYSGGYGNAAMPSEIVAAVIAAIPVKVIVDGTPLTYGEQLTGFARGATEDYEAESMYAVSDYGRAWDAFRVAYDAGTGGAWLAEFLAAELPKIHEGMRRVVEVARRRTTDYKDRDPQHVLMECVVLVLRPNGFTPFRMFSRKALGR